MSINYFSIIYGYKLSIKLFTRKFLGFPHAFIFVIISLFDFLRVRCSICTCKFMEIMLYYSTNILTNYKASFRMLTQYFSFNITPQLTKNKFFILISIKNFKLPLKKNALFSQTSFENIKL